MKRSPLRKTSKSMASMLREYVKIKRKYLEDHQVCEVCCLRPATDIHHKRGRLGSLLCNTSFFLAVDRKCHTLIETQRAWAREKGYLLDRVASSNYE